MSTRFRPRRLRILTAAALLVALVALPSAASADTTTPPSIFPATSDGATVNVTGGPITAKLLATVRVEFRCDPLRTFDWDTGETGMTTEGRIEFFEVALLQAQGKRIVHGTGTVFGGSVTCDGETVNVREVLVTTLVSPWKSGTAVAGARVSISDPDLFDGHFASSGPIVISLGGK